MEVTYNIGPLAKLPEKIILYGGGGFFFSFYFAIVLLPTNIFIWFSPSDCVSVTGTLSVVFSEMRKATIYSLAISHLACNLTLMCVLHLVRMSLSIAVSEKHSLACMIPLCVMWISLFHLWTYGSCEKKKCLKNRRFEHNSPWEEIRILHNHLGVCESCTMLDVTE